ncbi:MAG: L-aspartate oxidase [Firmicutes bacterium]|nr:L-aspartate oxidase [Bacillota bacterium]
MYTALKINPDFEVLLLSKEAVDENNSSLAQGGIAACVKSDDSFKLHIEDTLEAGSNMNDIDKLEQLVKCAPNNIEELIALGVEFDREDNGSIKSTMEGGHSRRRVLHAGGDATGREIVKALSIQVKNRSNITVLEDIMALDLILNDSKCVGITALKDSKILNIYSNDTVIATGGIGEIYNNSTNSTIATGDGIAMAYRGGCEINNMEFIQFHPTAFYSKDKGKKFLISEAVRGEGAVLRNKSGERFMEKYHPSKDLAPRDIVSQCIYKEMEKSNTDHVYLDITHRDKEYLENRFPTIYNQCLANGIDMSKDLIPVLPVQHYSIGGIKVDMVGRTNIPSLYACGECSNTGVHGANRLASNSLLECIVFGKKISNDINKNLECFEQAKLSDKDTLVKNQYNVQSNTDIDIYKVKKEIKETMEKYVGIVRWESGLLNAKKKIEGLSEKLKSCLESERACQEAKNMITIALLIINACLDRKESIGCHFRIDKNNGEQI